MSAPLQRGSVVLREGWRSVVWEVRDARLILLPVIVPRTFWRHDVLLSFTDLVAMGGAAANSQVRPKRNPPIVITGHKLVGVVPGQTMCRVVQGVIRAIAEATTEQRLLDERRQRDNNRDERCVNLVGAARR